MRGWTLAKTGVAAMLALMLAAGCDRSPQTADGATKAGDAGTAAATGDGAVADTGSPEQGGAAGAGRESEVQGGLSSTTPATGPAPTDAATPTSATPE